MTTIEWAQAFSPIKDNYHHEVNECLEIFKTLPEIKQNEILKKSKHMLEQTTKNHPELKKILPENRKKFLDSLKFVNYETKMAFVELIRTYFGETLEMPISNKVDFQGGDIVVPIDLSENDYDDFEDVDELNDCDYPLNLPAAKESDFPGNCYFINLGGRRGHTMPRNPNRVRLPDLWEVVAFLVSVRNFGYKF